MTPDRTENQERINCMHCKYFHVSWDPKFPRGCKLYGFKTAGFPSVEVLKATGEECLGFEKKQGVRG